MDRVDVVGILSKISQKIDFVDDYVDRVLSKEIPFDAEIGKMIFKLISQTNFKYDTVLNRTYQDLELISNITALTKTQIEISEKLNSLIV